MKTKSNKIISTLIGKAILTTVVLLGCNEISYSQQKLFNETPSNLGIAVASQISANGYGSEYNPMLYLKNGRKSYFIGPVIQKQKLNVSGVRFNYDYTIVGEDAQGNEAYNKNLELFCFFIAAYHHNALLGKRALWEERMANREYDGDFSKLHFQSIEIYGGFGLKIKLFKNIKWVNCLGLGGYTSFNFPGHLYYNANNIGLILKTGISFDIKK